MATLQSTNVLGTLCVNGVAVGGGKDVYFCCITASTTWTPPSDLVTGDGIVDTIVVAGGGGGGLICTTSNFYRICSAGGGGGGGEVRHFPCVMTSSNDACTITIGAGGNSGSKGGSCFIVPNAGSPGGDSSAFAVTSYGGGGGGSVQWATNNTCTLTTCFQDLFGGPWGAKAAAPTCQTNHNGLRDLNPAMGGTISAGGSSADGRPLTFVGLQSTPTSSTWCLTGKEFNTGPYYLNSSNTKQAEGYPHGTDYFSPGGTSACIAISPGRHSFGEFSQGCALGGYHNFFDSGSSASCGAGGGAGSMYSMGGSGTRCMRGGAGNDGVVVLKWQQ
jgi:hypothetical protein